jgi:hypothetical protein
MQSTRKVGIALGKTLGVDYSPLIVNQLEGYHLSPFGEANARAAALCYLDGEINEIWLVMGFTSNTAESREMERYILDHYQIPSSAIVVLTEATNTVEELREVVSLMKSQKISASQVFIITAGFQKERSEQILRSLLKGNPIAGYINAEEKIEEKEEPGFTEKHRELRLAEAKKEKTGRLLLRIDPKWRFFGPILLILRKFGIS